MKIDEMEVLTNWILEHSEFNQNDLLANLNESKIIDFQEEYEFSVIKKWILEAQQSIKESGINPLCCGLGKIAVSLNNVAVTIPIWIVPCHFSINKLKQTVSIELDAENGILNPYLDRKFQTVFDLQIPDSTFEQAIDYLKSLETVQVEEHVRYIGNFHHHRYVLLKELADIVQLNDQSDSLRQYIGGEKSSDFKLDLPDEFILPFDTDQVEAIQKIKTDNCVVQGPPGTGKSQLLTNLICQLLLGDKKFLVVSEKRAALEVVQKRLSQKNLHHFCQIITDDLTSASFITKLKETWQYLDQLAVQTPTRISARKDLENNLQLIFDILNQPGIIGDISYSEFRKLTKNIDFKDFQFVSNPPSLKNFDQTIGFIQQVYQNQMAMQVASLNFHVYQQFDVNQLTDKINRLEKLLDGLENIRAACTMKMLDSLNYDAVICQLFENEIRKKYSSVLTPNSKAQQKFIKHSKAWKKLKKEQESVQLTDWKIVPSQLEIKWLKNLLTSKNYFKKLKLRKRWNELSVLSLDFAKEALQQLENYYSTLDAQTKLERQLNDLGIYDMHEIDTIHASIAVFDEVKWSVYNQLTTDAKNQLLQIGSDIQTVKALVKELFIVDENCSLKAFIQTFKSNFQYNVMHLQKIQQLSKEQLSVLLLSESFEAYLKHIFGTHWTLFQQFYPLLSQFDIHTLDQRLKTILQAREDESELVYEKIVNQLKKQFDAYHSLLLSSTVKLTDQQKELRTKLKKGKAILVKEFAKTRQYPSIRELFNSDARVWIELLQPIILTNPTQVATIFPLDKAYFDLCIVDEASQIPQSNVVGAFYRSKRVVLAGDEKQMSPHTYFKAGSQDVVSALHQATYYFDKAFLRHHYRSKYPQLIAFSNKYFYNNQLITYPSYPDKSDCIQLHYCPEGIFENRGNLVEARKAVELLLSYLPNQKSIGVVAFSQQQIDLILSEIPANYLSTVAEAIENNQLFFKSLDKVQGDECQQLIISLGYAPNSDGEFRMHFGPLNLATGKNRLNVLLTRASETMDFICSIRSKQIQWSQNESVFLLSQWLIHLETIVATYSQNNSTSKFVIEHDSILLEEPFVHYKNVKDLITRYDVLSKRAWSIRFD